MNAMLFNIINEKIPVYIQVTNYNLEYRVRCPYYEKIFIKKIILSKYSLFISERFRFGKKKREISRENASRKHNKLNL